MLIAAKATIYAALSIEAFIKNKYVIADFVLLFNRVK